MRELIAPIAPPSVTLRARYAACETVALPPFLGGTVHGALGHAIAAVGASIDDVLGPRAAPEPAPGFVRANPPPAAVIVPPPLDLERSLGPGDRLDLAVLLLRPDTARVGVVIAALEEVGRRGLGRGRGRLELVAVEDSLGDVVWKEGEVLRSPQPDPVLQVGGAGPWTLRTRTPLHLVRGGGLVARPIAVDLVVAAARRLVALAWVYGEPPDLDLRELERAAVADLTGAPVGDWHERLGERWSERQRRRHPVRGVLGSIPLAPTAAPYIELLAQALRFGLGKGTALGLGQLDLTLRV